MGLAIGIIGCGAFAQHFVKLYQDHPGVDRLALSDHNAEKLAETATRFGVRETYDSLDAACASDLDALVIITQHWLHAPQAIQAMEAGKHVYTAVPAARSLEECDALVRAVERTGQLYMNGETSYFRAECAWARQQHAAGRFGDIVLVEAEYLHDLDHGLREVAQRRHGSNFGPSKTGGIPMHYPSHSLCFAVSIPGQHAVSVSCLGYSMADDDWWRPDTESGNTMSNQTALFEMSGGATARICEYRRVGHPGAERVTRVYGTEGSFEASLAGNRWCTKKGCEPVEIPADFEPLPPALAADKGGHGGSHAYLVNEFVEAVTAERQPRVNVWEAVRYCAPGLVAHQSAVRGGERLAIPDWGDAPA